MVLTKYQIEYNQVLARVDKAEEMFEDDRYTQQEKDSWRPKYKELVAKLNELLQDIRFYDGFEILHGFTEKKQQEINFKEENKWN